MVEEEVQLGEVDEVGGHASGLGVLVANVARDGRREVDAATNGVDGVLREEMRIGAKIGRRKTLPSGTRGRQEERRRCQARHRKRRKRPSSSCRKCNYEEVEESAERIHLGEEDIREKYELGFSAEQKQSMALRAVLRRPYWQKIEERCSKM